ncbi:glycosyltransferase [Herbiconiux sp. L3-i23]|uniref:glycosyltransferase n=1 Tax=Herbiconiux sp. L3-i23 TaxID=2905871 RepID=UPI0020607734|nr:glycosyltransferase [Herbiconiux sp. L3-i23]BDI23323.1 glycosyl transferase [Herbiconiux sp. L3-i23]
MRVFGWHMHGGWMDAFVRGDHDYVLPIDADGGGGIGKRDWDRAHVHEAPAGSVTGADVDVLVLQRLEEFDWAEERLGLRPGRDIPTIFVEHNTPRASVPESRHPLADRDDILIAHVTHFNALFWDTGRAPTTVIEHGIVDRGYLYTGELARMGVVINEPVRRWRVSGSDLIGGFSRVAPVDVFGMKVDGLARELGVSSDVVADAGDLPTDDLHRELARRRLYLHTTRWTSLGLALLEAMHAGIPVVGIEATEIRRAVPPEAGTVSTRLDELHRAARRFIEDPEAARTAGLAAREYALEHYGLRRFQDDWNTVLADWTESFARRRRAA